jgi:uncharacterized protein YutE (UPF0331/DUF86 family)
MGKINIRQIIKEELDIALDEMARAKVIYTVNDKSSLEKVVDAVKGNTKLALQYLLDKGEMAVADLAKELKKDPASFNNPGFRKLMSDLSDKNIISVGSAGTLSTPSTPKAVSSIPKTSKSTPKNNDEEEMVDTYYKADDEFNSVDDEDIESSIEKNLKKVKNTKNDIATKKDEYKALIKQMKDIAAKYKLASGEEAKSLVSQLKDLTKEKKRLEAILNPKIDNEEDL